MCNAGALLNTKTLTQEGFETTFAVHLLFGAYFLIQSLLKSRVFSTEEEGPRVVVVSSGGMYNSPFPRNYERVKNPDSASYDGESVSE